MSFLSRVPRPASSPPPEGGGLSLCRPSGRLASTKQTSATAARRSPVPYARRPRSRLGNPARQSRSGGRHRFRRSPSPPVQARRFAATFPVSPSPAFIHARRTAPSQKFLPYLPASTGPAAFRADPDHASSFSTQPNCSKKPPPRLINQSRSRPDRRHTSFRQTLRRRISDNAIYVK